jgi:catechol 2,3-dioxygenase-like lactoylglutathione lyase family enzyme
MSTRIGGITIDTNDIATSSAFWAAATGYEVTSTDESGAFLGDPAGAGTGLYLQLVPEPATAKNRVHLDLAAGDVAAEADRLLGLGATEVAKHDGWIVLADTDGNQFCVVPS